MGHPPHPPCIYKVSTYGANHIFKSTKYESPSTLVTLYKVLPDPRRGDIILGLFRHDFMYATAEPRSDTAHLDGQFKLVEFNLVASRDELYKNRSSQNTDSQ